VLNLARFDEYLFARFDPDLGSSIHADRSGCRLFAKFALYSRRFLFNLIPSSRSSFFSSFSLIDKDKNSPANSLPCREQTG
jgi:hypothetical protein